LSTFGIGREWSEQEWGAIVNELIRDGYVERWGEYRTLRVTPRGREALRTRDRISLRGKPMGPRAAPPRRPRCGAADDGAAMDQGGLALGAEIRQPDPVLFERLRVVRRQIASDRGMPPYVIFHDSTLRQMAAEIPTTRAQLARIQGVGQRKLDDLGEQFLAEIRQHVQGRADQDGGDENGRPDEGAAL
jgi:ATP-dependent DNA helicase RecQ